MSDKSSPKSKRLKEKIAQEEAKKQTKNRTVIYAVIAVAVAVAVIAAIWFLMQPGPVSMDSMKKSLNDAHYDTTDVTLSSTLTTAGAVSGFSFSMTTDHGAQTLTMYEFKDGDSASAYAKTVNATGSQAALAKGVFVLYSGHAHVGVMDDEVVDLFNALMNGKHIGHNSTHNH